MRDLTSVLFLATFLPLALGASPPPKESPKESPAPTDLRAVVLGEEDHWTALGCASDMGELACPESFTAVSIHPVDASGTVEISSSRVRWRPSPNAEPCAPIELLPGKEAREKEARRPMTVLSNDHAAYRAAVAKAVGVEEVTLQKLIKVDLESDGVDEVLVQAAFQGPMTEEVGELYDLFGIERTPLADFSVVAVRKVVKDQPVAFVTLGRGEVLPNWYGQGYSIEGLTDLEGDGTLEVVMSQRGDHGFLRSVQSVQGTTAKNLASAACGW